MGQSLGLNLLSVAPVGSLLALVWRRNLRMGGPLCPVRIWFHTALVAGWFLRRLRLVRNWLGELYFLLCLSIAFCSCISGMYFFIYLLMSPSIMVLSFL